MRVAGGPIEKLTNGPRVVQSIALGPAGKMAVLASTATEMPEVHALENGALRPLTHQNDAWLAEIQLGTTEGIEFKTPDGADVHAVDDASGGRAGHKMPTLLRIHGGPTSQDQYSFNFERELFAANGYVVVSPNYRGSNGRGEKFMNAISAAIGATRKSSTSSPRRTTSSRRGSPIPDRLGIGGWSYGGITTTTRSRRRRASRRRSAARAARCRRRCTAWTSTSCSTRRSSGRRGRTRTRG